MGFWSRQIKHSVRATIIDARRKQIAEHNKEVKIKEYAKSLLTSVSESTKIIKTTTKPEDFFSHYALLMESLEKLIELEEIGVLDNVNFRPRDSYQKLSDLFVDGTNDFIGRFFSELQTKVSELSSDNAKADLIKRYFRSMDKHIVKMETESINYYYSLKEQYLI